LRKRKVVKMEDDQIDKEKENEKLEKEKLEK
jgi:hypothetical protein